jgi:site-specific DNA-methyltransferase (adenine-specific)
MEKINVNEPQDPQCVQTSVSGSLSLDLIYNENCFETMSKIKDNSIDLVITSPPYNKAGYEGFIRKRHDKDSWKGRNIDYGDESENDFMIEEDYKNEQIKMLNELHRILKPNGSVFYNHKVRVAQHKGSHPIEWILKSNFTFRQQITWNRKNSPAVAPIRYLPNTELIFWLTKTACQPNFERQKDSLFIGEVWEFSAKPNKLHPAPFPEELPINIIMNLKDKKNAIVYDPYAGTGTTCKVAKQFGLNYIGSEINKCYAERANFDLNGLLF